MYTLLRSAAIQIDQCQADSDGGYFGAAVTSHGGINQMSAQLEGLES